MKLDGRKSKVYSDDSPWMGISELGRYAIKW